MESVLLYPYDDSSEIIVRKSHLLQDMKIKKAVSVKGWAYKGKMLKTNEDQILIEEDFEKALNECTLVWIVNSRFLLPFEIMILPKIERALQRGKKILITRNLNEQEYEMLFNRYGDNRQVCIPIGLENAFRPGVQKLFDIHVPVIMITGTVENVEKFSLQLALREEALRDGYKIAQIGTRNESWAFGMYSFPTFIYKNNLSEKEKILGFNHWIKKIEQEENPDFLILGVPGEMGVFQNKILGNMGIVLWQVLAAVKADLLVAGMLYQDYVPEQIEMIKEGIWKNMGMVPDILNIAARTLDMSTTQEREELSYLSVDKEKVLEKVAEIADNTVFAVPCDGEQERMWNFIKDNYFSDAVEEEPQHCCFEGKIEDLDSALVPIFSLRTGKDYNNKNIWDAPLFGKKLQIPVREVVLILRDIEKLLKIKFTEDELQKGCFKSYSSVRTTLLKHKNALRCS